MAAMHKHRFNRNLIAHIAARTPAFHTKITHHSLSQLGLTFQKTNALAAWAISIQSQVNTPMYVPPFQII